MSYRTMSDRDHLIALVTAAEAFLRNGNTCSPQENVALQLRLTGAVERAKQDLTPRG